jgi:hypothetical protein
MIVEIRVRLEYFIAEPCDVLLQIEAAAMADQRLVSSNLIVGSPEALVAVEGEESIGQRTWAVGQGTFNVAYDSVVAIDRPMPDFSQFRSDPPRYLPALVIPYLMPSRYCESNLFEAFVNREFGGVQGGAKITAMRRWMMSNIDYVSGTSDGDTTAAGGVPRLRAFACQHGPRGEHSCTAGFGLRTRR